MAQKILMKAAMDGEEMRKVIDPIKGVIRVGELNRVMAQRVLLKAAMDVQSIWKTMDPIKGVIRGRELHRVMAQTVRMEAAMDGEEMRKMLTLYQMDLISGARILQPKIR